MTEENALLRERSYRVHLRAALEDFCEIFPTAGQLDGLLNGLERKNLTLASGPAYFDAEAYVLKAAFGCVEDAIRRAQRLALRQAVEET